MVKNPPSNAGDVGSIPGRGTKIPHAAGQLSPHATNYRAHVLWSPSTTARERKNVHTTTREEKTRTAQPEKRKPARRNERSLMPHQRSCVLQLSN